MKILIDTHIFLWLFDNNSPLTNYQREMLEHPDNAIYISHYSIMEIAIKISIGKLPSLKLGIDQLVAEAENKNLNILPSLNYYAITYLQVPLFDNHRDPFDRFIIATAKFEKMIIMTNDEKFKLYEGFVELCK